jgi:transposase
MIGSMSEPVASLSEEKLNELKAEFAKVVGERDELRRLYQALLVTCRKLERGILFQGRERDLGPASTTLGLLAMMTGSTPTPPATPAPEKEKVKAHERAKPTGRKALPENLPRVDIEVLPSEVERQGLDRFERIGEDISETIERRPGSLVVVRVHRPKFVTRTGRQDMADAVMNVTTTGLGSEPAEKTETAHSRQVVVTEQDPAPVVHQASALELPISRGLAGPGLLAHTIVSRWGDHLPLHRLERIYRRDGWEVARSTICGWHMTLASMVKPLLDAMWIDILKAPFLCVDATGVLVQEKKKCRHGHFFVVAAPERHILFGYSPKHNSAAVDALLRGYTGYLVADAHSVYEHLCVPGGVTKCGCWSHVRRYFFKALGTDPERARHALGLIKLLFEIERQAKKSSPAERLVARQAFSKPILETFFTWCDRESLHVLDESPIAKAIQYARNQREELCQFLNDGRIPCHNNLSESELRREAVGRKNWIFLGSDDGGETNATFVSLLASCQHHEIEPTGYFTDLFCLLPGWNVQQILELAPVHWKRTSQRDDVRRLLESNVHRRISLGLPVPPVALTKAQQGDPTADPSRR